MKRKLAVTVLITVCIVTGCTTKADACIRNTVNSTEILDGSFFQLEIFDAEYRDTVEPEKPAGYYHYFKEVEEAHFLVIKGSIKRQVEEVLDVHNVNCNIVIKGKQYDGAVRIENQEGSDLITEIAENMKYKILIFALVDFIR